MDVKFLVDAANVIADGIQTDMQLIGGRLITEAVGQKLEQTDFLRCELLLELWRRSGFLKERHDFARDLR